MKKIVIKCGGSIIDELTPEFFASLKQLQQHGYQLIFVHGGGPDINKMLSMYEVQPEFHNGLRKTTKETLEIAELCFQDKRIENLYRNYLNSDFRQSD